MKQAGAGSDAAPTGSVWELTFAHSPVGIALVSMDGEWLQVNDALCRMLGRPAEELLAGTFQQITHPDDVGPDVDLLAECIAGRRDDYRMSKRYLRPDGEVVWGDLSVAVVRDEDGAALHLVSQILDVTQQRADRVRLEEALADAAAANADLQTFAALVSHELKTPLTAVRAWLELLADLLADEGEPRRIVGRVETAADRMDALIDALLALTTIERHGRTADRTDASSPHALADVAATAAADLGGALRRGGGRVEIAPGLTSLPSVDVSADLVRTLFTTLFSNAIKYRARDRRLRITVDAVATSAGTTEDDAASVTVSVANDGPGIPAGHRERLFDMFARGDDGPVAGFGIGLAACRRIVEWHGGRIWLHRGEEGDVDFRFTLPLAPVTTAGGAVAPDVAAGPAPAV